MNKSFVLGFICAADFAWLAWCSHFPEEMRLLEFAALIAIVYISMLWMFLNYQNGFGAIHIIAFAVLFRVIGFYGAPIYEDDFFRYLWDGYRFAVVGTPYGLAPEAFFSDAAIPERFQQILSGINHPDIATIYAPTFQYLFLLAYWIDPGELWPLKLILIVADCLTLLLLSYIVQARYLLLYAWNPLVIKEIAFTAHPDGLLGGLLITAWILIVHGRRISAVLMLVLAAGTKVAAWPVLPFLLIRCGSFANLIFLFGFMLLYVPFWMHGDSDFQGLSTFAKEFEFNSALYGLFNPVLPDGWARPLLGLSYLIAVSVYFLHYLRQKVISPPRIDILLGGLLLISPVINPWYLLWLLPWACIRPNLTAWVASGAIFLSYVTGLNLDDAQLSPYGHPDWVRPVEFGFIFLALVWDLYRKEFRSNNHQYS